jgi:hypothetical protein
MIIDFKYDGIKEMVSVHYDLSTVKQFIKSYQKEQQKEYGVSECPDYFTAVYKTLIKDRKQVVKFVGCGGKDGFDVWYIECGTARTLQEFIDQIQK